MPGGPEAIDALMNNAGTVILGAAEEVTPEEVLRLFQATSSALCG